MEKSYAYEVDAARTKPAVYPLEGYSAIWGGVLSLLASLGFCYLVVEWVIAEHEGIRTVFDINLFANGERRQNALPGASVKPGWRRKLRLST